MLDIIKTNTINNLKKGDVVYHLNSKKIRMIIERINQSRNKILCGWLDQNGKIVSLEFKPEELGKVSNINSMTSTNFSK